MAKLQVVFFEVDRENKSTPLTNAWVYWRTTSQKLILRVNAEGLVFGIGSGPTTDPASYTVPFTADAGVPVKVAHNTEQDQLPESALPARLQAFTPKASAATSVAAAGPITAKTDGSKQKVQVTPKAELKLKQFIRPDRGVVATLFGGQGNDPQASNMDKFLKAHYGSPGAAAIRFQGAEEKGLRDELRATVAASGTDPIDIVNDVASAARVAENLDADAHIIALVLHGNTDRIGRVDPGFFLTDASMLDLVKFRNDSRRVLGALKRAKDKLQEAENAPPRERDLEKIQAARDEVQSRQEDVDRLDQDALTMSNAFEAAAAALEQARVKVVELQACDSGAPAAGIDSLGFLGRLEAFLSTGSNRVQVKGHPKTIFSLSTGSKVKIWIGAETDKDGSGTQTSETSLPLP